GVKVTLIAADRNVFARQKGVRAEAVTGFIIVGSVRIVVEHPARVLGAAGFMDETAELLVLTVPESAHAAVLAIHLPQPEIDMSLAVERRNKLITVARRAGRELLRAGKMEPDALEHVWQGHGGISCSRGVDSLCRDHPAIILPAPTRAIFDLHQSAKDSKRLR